MPFNTPFFVCFLGLFLVLFHVVARTQTQKLWVIVVGSVVFYAAWDYRFVPLLVGTGLFNFYIAREVARCLEARSRARKLVAISVVVNLGVLAYFKLANVGAEWTTARFMIPLGLSFFVFRSMSYPIDVYRRSLRARERPLEFLAGVVFFPHIVAGPIARWAKLLPQLESLAPPSRELVKRGCLYIAIGAANKTIADLLTTIPDRFYQDLSHGPHSALHAWTAAIAYAGTIYGDFAGYSAMAIGLASLVGVQLPENFNLPYLAASMGEFWQRWHISLSTWFRDYLFLPMALRYPTRPYILTMVTMVLVGLWHGASASFIVFGFYHGVIRVVSAATESHTASLGERFSERLMKVVMVAITFYLVVVGFVLFRAPTLEQAALVLRDMHVPPAVSVLSNRSMWLFALALLGPVGCHLVSALERVAKRWPALAWPIVVTGGAFAALFASHAKPFIYSHF